MESILDLVVIGLLFVALIIVSFFLKKENRIAYIILLVIRCLVIVIETILLIANIMAGDTFIFNLVLILLSIFNLTTLVDMLKKRDNLEFEEKKQLQKELDEIRKDFVRKETEKNKQNTHLDIG